MCSHIMSFYDLSLFLAEPTNVNPLSQNFIMSAQFCTSAPYWRHKNLVICNHLDLLTPSMVPNPNSLPGFPFPHWNGDFKQVHKNLEAMNVGGLVGMGKDSELRDLIERTKEDSELTFGDGVYLGGRRGEIFQDYSDLPPQEHPADYDSDSESESESEDDNFAAFEGEFQAIDWDGVVAKDDEDINPRGTDLRTWVSAFFRGQRKANKLFSLIKCALKVGDFRTAYSFSQKTKQARKTVDGVSKYCAAEKLLSGAAYENRLADQLCLKMPLESVIESLNDERTWDSLNALYS